MEYNPVIMDGMLAHDVLPIQSGAQYIIIIYHLFDADVMHHYRSLMSSQQIHARYQFGLHC